MYYIFKLSYLYEIQVANLTDNIHLCLIFSIRMVFIKISYSSKFHAVQFSQKVMAFFIHCLYELSDKHIRK